MGVSVTSGSADHTLQPPFDAVIFDMDGVVTDTATLHARAWKLLFDAVLADPRSGAEEATPAFDLVEDYRRYIDGRTREDGVTAFLAARGIEVPTGTAGDATTAWTVHGLAKRKNDLFHELVATEGVRGFPGTVDLIGRLRSGRTPLALVTASRNATRLLTATGLEAAFDVVVDGGVMEAMSLPGKPDPAAFLEAARRLGVPPARAVVVEDALAGVLAAHAGGFGLVVGIDRIGQRRELEGAGAHLVLDDVAELDVGASLGDPWRLVYRGFDPAHESHREALTTLGNGYVATRGAMPEHHDDGLHYPGTYLAGVYNRLASTVADQRRVDEELVNAPNWLPFDVAIGDGGWWSLGGVREEDQERELDLQRGLLTRRARLVDPAGRVLRIVQRRLVSMDRPHLAALETTMVAEGWSGAVRIHSGVDPGVVNGNDVESLLLANRHLVQRTVEQLDDVLLCEVETSQSHIRIATAVRTRVPGRHETPTVERASAGTMLRLDLEMIDGVPVTVEKLAAMFTSRDAAIASPREGALAELELAEPSFAALLERHQLAWRRLWEHFAVGVDTDAPVQLALNLHVYHLLTSLSPHTTRVDAGIPARGLHGEGYRGHVFWDELFVLPLVLLRIPALARALLDYRWRRLDAARHAARQEGLAGAMFPWQSGSDGREETPATLFNPRSQRWIPDNSRRQRHVGLAVAYNSWQYFQATGDTRWFAERGAEILFEVMRFFADLADHVPGEDRFHIHGVMGPDEYHDGYPDTPGAGVRDSAYTNVLTAWLCRRAVDALTLLPAHECAELCERIGLTPGEVDGWRRLGSRMAVAFHDGVISQFEGYGDLLELDWPRYRRTYGNIERLDLILEAEQDSTNRYRVSKQADVLMLIYLLGADQVAALLGELGYPTTTEDLGRTVDYYLARTAHGSTLSRVVHTSVLAALDRSTAWSEFRQALGADLDDTQGGTTGRGIHLGAMAGTVDVVMRTFTGMRIQVDALEFRPRPPGALRDARFEVSYRDQRISVSLERHRLRLVAAPSPVPPVPVVVDGQAALLHPGETLEFPLPGRGPRPQDGP